MLLKSVARRTDLQGVGRSLRQLLARRCRAELQNFSVIAHCGPSEAFEVRARTSLWSETRSRLLFRSFNLAKVDSGGTKSASTMSTSIGNPSLSHDERTPPRSFSRIGSKVV